MYVRFVIVMVSIGITTLPILFGRGEKGIKHRFISLLCYSFIVPVFYYILGFFVHLPVQILAIHTLVWSMFFVSYISWYLEKKVFFYSLLSISLSIVVSFLIGGISIFIFGAIVSLIVLIEAFVYLIWKGSSSGRSLSTFGLLSSILLILYFYPSSPLKMSEGTVFISYVLLSYLLLIFVSTPRKEMELLNTGT